MVRFVVAYLVAATVETVVFCEWRGGHADVPFTTFPDYLAIAPLVPVLVGGDLGSKANALAIASTAVFGAVLVAVWVAIGRARARRGHVAPGGSP